MCKLATPKTLWTKFEEMPPVFVNREVLEATVSKEMLDYLIRTGRKRTTGKKLLGVLEADEILLYRPLLRWYIEHGVELQVVYTTIEYQPGKILAWLVDEVTDAPCMGDTDKESHICRGLQTTRKQQLWKNDRGLGKAHQRELYEE